MINGLSHHYHLGESTVSFTGIGSSFKIFIQFLDEFSHSKQNSPEGMLRSAASHLGLNCLNMCLKKCQATMSSVGNIVQLHPSFVYILDVAVVPILHVVLHCSLLISIYSKTAFIWQICCSFLN